MAAFKSPTNRSTHMRAFLWTAESPGVANCVRASNNWLNILFNICSWASGSSWLIISYADSSKSEALRIASSEGTLTAICHRVSKPSLGGWRSAWNPSGVTRKPLKNLAKQSNALSPHSDHMTSGLQTKLLKIYKQPLHSLIASKDPFVSTPFVKNEKNSSISTGEFFINFQISWRLPKGILTVRLKP